MFQVNTVEDNPNRYVMYEIYVGEDAIETHMNSDHMKSFRSDTADMVKDRVITILNVVTEFRGTSADPGQRRSAITKQLLHLVIGVN